MNHDWNTLTLEEVKIGQRAILKINKNSLLHPYFISLKKLGLQEVAVQIIAADNKSGSVLVLFQDHDNLQVFSVWSSIGNLKPLQILMRGPNHQLPLNELQEEFKEEMYNYLNFACCKTLINVFPLDLHQINQQMPLIDMLKASVVKQFNEDPVSGFFQSSQDQMHNLLAYLNKQLFETPNAEFRKEVVKSLQLKFLSIV